MKVGDTLTFHYPNFGQPDGYPDYREHSGQQVTIIREEEAEEPELTGRLFAVKAADGWTGDVWESELGTPDFSPHDPEFCGCGGSK